MGSEVCVSNSSPTIVPNDEALKKQYYSKLANGKSHIIDKSSRKLFESKLSEDDVRQLWRRADAVCFDVDSTVCQDEAIDEFAKFLGKGAEVAACTQQAMNGNMSFREALRLRLNLMRPTRSQLEEYANTHKIRLTNGIFELVEKLKQRNVDVYLISGGFRRLILPVAKILGIPSSRVYANELTFDNDGNYTGFDLTEPTSDSGNIKVGKAGVCGALKAKYNYQTLIMVGDGATDAEACPPADAFVGFGANQIRDSVRKLSSWYVYNFQTLIDQTT